MNIDNSPPLDWHINELAVARLGLHTCIRYMAGVPEMVTEDDPLPAWEQFEARYPKGWNALLPGGFVLTPEDWLRFPGDPPLEPIAAAFLRDEKIIIYPYSWVCIVQKDQSFSIARMD